MSAWGTAGQIPSFIRLRSGLSTIWVILLLPVVLVLLWGIFDLSRLWLVRAELTNALEAGALSGVKTLGDGGTASEARLDTQQLAAANTVLGNSFTLNLNQCPGSFPSDNPNGNLDCNGEILIGTVTWETSPPRFVFDPNSQPGCSGGSAPALGNVNFDNDNGGSPGNVGNGGFTSADSPDVSFHPSNGVSTLALFNGNPSAGALSLRSIESGGGAGAILTGIEMRFTTPTNALSFAFGGDEQLEGPPTGPAWGTLIVFRSNVVVGCKSIALNGASTNPQTLDQTLSIVPAELTNPTQNFDKAVFLFTRMNVCLVPGGLDSNNDGTIDQNPLLIVSRRGEIIDNISFGQSTGIPAVLVRRRLAVPSAVGPTVCFPLGPYSVQSQALAIYDCPTSRPRLATNYVVLPCNDCTP